MVKSNALLQYYYPGTDICVVKQQTPRLVTAVTPGRAWMDRSWPSATLICTRGHRFWSLRWKIVHTPESKS